MMADIIFSCYIGILIVYFAMSSLPCFKEARFKIWLFMNGAYHG